MTSSDSAGVHQRPGQCESLLVLLGYYTTGWLPGDGLAAGSLTCQAGQWLSLARQTRAHNARATTLRVFTTDTPARPYQLQKGPDLWYAIWGL